MKAYMLYDPNDQGNVVSNGVHVKAMILAEDINSAVRLSGGEEFGSKPVRVRFPRELFTEETKPDPSQYKAYRKDGMCLEISPRKDEVILSIREIPLMMESVPIQMVL